MIRLIHLQGVDIQTSFAQRVRQFFSGFQLPGGGDDRSVRLGQRFDD